MVGSGPDAYDGTRGVAVLMRYTLRLLTAQQFQRASALVCACEMLRRERVEAGDSRWGTTPFRIGLWVGSSVSPNSFEEAERQITESRGSERVLGGVLQLPVCPWCGSRLSSANVQTNRLRRRVLVYCSDPEGDCAFSPRNSPDEGLPVLTVDEEIYRLTPGAGDRHGGQAGAAAVEGVDRNPVRAGGHASARGTGGRTRISRVSAGRAGIRRGADLPRGVIRPAMRLRPPDLIIQDELHLISDALGSMVGLYETAIDRLSSRRPDPARARRLHRDRAAGARPGGAGVRARA